jgi:hypothetical protein
MEPWESFRTIVPSTFAILGTIGNTIWETHFTKKPSVERNLFDCRDAFAAHTGATTEGFLICAPFFQVGLTAGPRSPHARNFGTTLRVGIDGSVSSGCRNLSLETQRRTLQCTSIRIPRHPTRN